MHDDVELDVVPEPEVIQVGGVWVVRIDRFYLFISRIEILSGKDIISR